MDFENQNQPAYGGLEELNNSDYEIKDGEPDITGWSVFNSGGDKIGEVADLLFDPQALKVRYIILELQANGTDIFDDDKKVLVPIGVATLHTHDDDVVLPLANAEALIALPRYETNSMTPDYELQVRRIFEPGSTAPYDHPQFYDHQHFDEDKFYQRGTVVNDQDMTDLAEEDAGEDAARAERVNRIVERINKKNT